jgi:hypothetical protein
MLLALPASTASRRGAAGSIVQFSRRSDEGNKAGARTGSGFLTADARTFVSLRTAGDGAAVARSKSMTIR